MYYIQRKSTGTKGYNTGSVKTVDQFYSYTEARRVRAEYEVSDSAGSFYISRTASNN